MVNNSLESIFYKKKKLLNEHDKTWLPRKRKRKINT